MTKLPRDAAAFAARVKMGSRRLWLVVEGRAHDRSFYDKVLESYPRLADGEYEVKLAEELKHNGRRAGGKPFALELLDYWADQAVLKQVAKDGTSTFICVALDRDLDQLSNVARTTPHVLYTSGMDVEADILRSTDLPRALSYAYSLSLEDARSIVTSGSEVFERLAGLYRNWITEGVVCLCGIGGTWREMGGPPASHRYSQCSEFHENDFGAEDLGAVAGARAATQVHLRTMGLEERGDVLRAEVDSIYQHGAQWRLVKGRWMTRFLDRLVASIPGVVLEARAPSAALAKVAIGLLPPGDDWYQHFEKRLDAVLAS